MSYLRHICCKINENILYLQYCLFTMYTVMQSDRNSSKRVLTDLDTNTDKGGVFRIKKQIDVSEVKAPRKGSISKLFLSDCITLHILFDIHY